jgi:DNA-binding CsgD family transcriptional regulator
LAEQTGVNWPEATYAGALLDAHLGRVGPAVAAAEQLLRHAQEGGAALYTLRSFAVLGLVDLSREDLGAASTWLGQASDLAFELGIGEPGLLRFVADQVEVLVGLCRIAEAESLLERFEGLARRAGYPWALATVGRCRGLIRAASDDLSGGLADLERARDSFEQLPFVFEYARTLLALGIVERRAKRRGRARTSLEAALEIFERLPAPLWADRVRTEVGRIGGRTSLGRELTPQEQRISELVAAGATNRELAAALFITVNTVEAALTRVYRKLSVRSRTELANHLLEAAPKL